ncbi:MAG: hypothetical protein Kow00124_26940 [Anaerolineae bacterium]
MIILDNLQKVVAHTIAINIPALTVEPGEIAALVGGAVLLLGLVAWRIRRLGR